MTRRDWYIGIGLLVLAVFAYTALPRYDWRVGMRDGYVVSAVRIDRWTGRLEAGRVSTGWPEYGRWMSWREIWTAQATSKPPAESSVSSARDMNLPPDDTTEPTAKCPANMSPMDCTIAQVSQPPEHR